MRELLQLDGVGTIAIIARIGEDDTAAAAEIAILPRKDFNRCN